LPSSEILITFVFLGFQYWKNGLGEVGEPKMARVKSEVQIFKESVLVEVTNPKTALPCDILVAISAHKMALLLAGRGSGTKNQERVSVAILFAWILKPRFIFLIKIISFCAKLLKFLTFIFFHLKLWFCSWRIDRKFNELVHWKTTMWLEKLMVYNLHKVRGCRSGIVRHNPDLQNLWQIVI
jgi:hypothetical protein